MALLRKLRDLRPHITSGIKFPAYAPLTLWVVIGPNTSVDVDINRSPYITMAHKAPLLLARRLRRLCLVASGGLVLGVVPEGLAQTVWQLVDNGTWHLAASDEYAPLQQVSDVHLDEDGVSITHLPRRIRIEIGVPRGTRVIILRTPL